MGIEELNEALNKTSEPDLKRGLIVNALLPLYPMLEMNPPMRLPIARDMASLRTNDYVQSLEPEDPLGLAIAFAEQLELESVDDDDEDWLILAEIIESLD